MRAFLVVAMVASMASAVISIATNCSICDIVDGYNESNGYYCFQINAETVACTCPDQRFVLNRRCRICDRPNICGANPNNTCSERSPSAFGGRPHYFACFCEDSKFHIGEACP